MQSSGFSVVPLEGDKNFSLEFQIGDRAIAAFRVAEINAELVGVGDLVGLGAGRIQPGHVPAVLPFVARSGCSEEEEECGGAYATSVVPTRAGYVAVAAGATWLSEDGLAWVELPPVATPGTNGGPGIVADGPAGVIGIGVGATEGEDTTTVWQLR